MRSSPLGLILICACIGSSSNRETDDGPPSPATVSVDGGPGVPGLPAFPAAGHPATTTPGSDAGNAVGGPDGAASLPPTATPPPRPGECGQDPGAGAPQYPAGGDSAAQPPITAPWGEISRCGSANAEAPGPEAGTEPTIALRANGGTATIHLPNGYHRSRLWPTVLCGVAYDANPVRTCMNVWKSSPDALEHMIIVAIPGTQTSQGMKYLNDDKHAFHEAYDALVGTYNADPAQIWIVIHHRDDWGFTTAVSGGLGDGRLPPAEQRPYRGVFWFENHIADDLDSKGTRPDAERKAGTLAVSLHASGGGYWRDGLRHTYWQIAEMGFRDLGYHEQSGSSNPPNAASLHDAVAHACALATRCYP